MIGQSWFVWYATFLLDMRSKKLKQVQIIAAATCIASGIYGAAAGMHGVSWQYMSRSTFIEFKKVRFSLVMFFSVV